MFGLSGEIVLNYRSHYRIEQSIFHTQIITACVLHQTLNENLNSNRHLLPSWISRRRKIKTSWICVGNTSMVVWFSVPSYLTFQYFTMRKTIQMFQFPRVFKKSRFFQVVQVIFLEEYYLPRIVEVEAYSHLSSHFERLNYLKKNAITNLLPSFSYGVISSSHEVKYHDFLVIEII